MRSSSRSYTSLPPRPYDSDREWHWHARVKLNWGAVAHSVRRSYSSCSARAPNSLNNCLINISLGNSVRAEVIEAHGRARFDVAKNVAKGLGVEGSG